MEEGVLRAIAKEALQRGTGARALRSILEEVMLDVRGILQPTNQACGDYGGDRNPAQGAEKCLPSMTCARSHNTLGSCAMA